MSSEENSACPSRAYIMDELTQCQLEAPHAGVHLGRVRVDDGEQLVQWADSDSVSDDGPVDETPIWYTVLPLGKIVEIDDLRGGGWANVLLDGAVLDDHEQIAALRVSYRASEEGLPQRVLVPWHAVSSLQWTDES